MNSRATGWEEACSLTDLCGLNVAWLKGEVPDHPCQDAPPDEETTSILRPLIRLNRSGLFTDFSQPGGRYSEDSAQRASVSGFCEKGLALALASLTLSSDLIVLATPTWGCVRCQIPITVDVYHPFTWSGCFDEDTLDPFARALGSEAMAALRAAWYVIVVDPVWGRPRYLWQRIDKVLAGGPAPFDVRPSPDLRLGVDFFW